MHAINQATIKKADISHIPAIKHINQLNLLSSKSGQAQDHIEQSGFLLTEHAEADVGHWVQDETNHIVLVAEYAGDIKGYIMACDISCEQSIKALPAMQKLQQASKIMYHKQIGIKESKKGYGGQLLLALYDAAVACAYDYVVCKISHEPYLNKVSISLHEKHGFKLLSTFQDTSFFAGLYLKKLK